MDNRENRYEQFERNAEKKTSRARVRNNANNVVKTRLEREASGDKETRLVSNHEKIKEKNNINDEVKHIKPNKVARVNSNETASARKRIIDGDLDTIKRRDLLINKIKETPDFEKQNWARKQLESSRLSANEIADIRRKNLNEPSDITTSKELIHKENYNEFKEKLKNRQLELKDLIQRYVKVDDIMHGNDSKFQWNESNKNYWQHHGNSPKEYDDLAKKYLNIKEQLATGKTIEELKKDPENKKAINFWWNDKSDKLTLTKYKDSYFIDAGHHRVELAKKHKIDEIPTYVNEAVEKKKNKF